MDNAQLPAAPVVSILHTDLPIIDYRGERVVSLAMIDQVHDRPKGTAGRNFHRHRERFNVGEDYHMVCFDEIRRNQIPGISQDIHRDVIFLTESGYLLLAKSFTDDLAWQVQRRLVACYFDRRGKGRPGESESQDQALLPLEAKVEALQAKVTAMAPKAEFYNAVTKSPDSMTLMGVAKVLGIPKLGRTKLFDTLRARRILFIEDGDNIPCQKYVNRGYFEVAIKSYTGPDWKTHVRKQTKVTVKGLEYLRRLLIKGGGANELELALLSGSVGRKVQAAEGAV